MSNVQSANVKPELANTKSTPPSKTKSTASHRAITHKVKHPKVVKVEKVEKAARVEKVEPKFKKARKISKSIKQIESEMSVIQSQMTKIGKDLSSVLNLMQKKNTQQASNKKTNSK